MHGGGFSDRARAALGSDMCIQQSAEQEQLQYDLKSKNLPLSGEAHLRDALAQAKCCVPSPSGLE